jgi:hypothetical protein
MFKDKIVLDENIPITSKCSYKVIYMQNKPSNNIMPFK